MLQFNIYYVVYNVPTQEQVEQLLWVVAAKNEECVVSILENYYSKKLGIQESDARALLLSADYAIVKIDHAYSTREGILEYADDIYSIFK